MGQIAQWIYCAVLACLLRYSAGVRILYMETTWSIASWFCWYTWHVELLHFFNMLTRELLAGKLWSYSANIYPSISDFKAENANHWLVRALLTSALLPQFEYLLFRVSFCQLSVRGSNTLGLIFYFLLYLFWKSLGYSSAYFDTGHVAFMLSYFITSSSNQLPGIFM